MEGIKKKVPKYLGTLDFSKFNGIYREQIGGKQPWSICQLSITHSPLEKKKESGLFKIINYNHSCH
jgi:hypothetical protein